MKLYHIGRALDNEIVVNDTTVSRRHAQLVVQDDGTVQLIDLNSSNGTFVNGHRVQGQAQLERNDIVKVGDHLLPWRNYVQAAVPVQVAAPVAQQAVAVAPAIARPQPQVDLPKTPSQVTPAQRSGRLMIWLAGVLAFAGVGVIIIVLVFLLVVPRASATDISGRWHVIDDPREWIEFKSDHTYQDGYANITQTKDATWSISGGRTLLIKREGTTLVKEYHYEDGILTLRQGNLAKEYELE
jgi:FHA domain